ncbi:MAG TPA: hypothetical protein VFH31_11795, partial [Pyrinomonadaceae bacterium]|nr:hypothetical protein [Pyrinomonadaceae bacterium]
QTTGFFGKLANSHTTLMNALDREGITSFPRTPTLTPVARFEFFRKGDRPSGVWLVRQGALRFALPITTGTKPGVADYLPAPHGLSGFAAPVEQIYPAMVPFVELEDGRTIVATDGADLIEPSVDGRALRVRWDRWAVLGAKSGELINVGLTSEVVWSIGKDTLTREELVTAKQPLRIRRWRFVVPATSANIETLFVNNTRIDRFASSQGNLEVKILETSFPITRRVVATGDSPLGRGVRGAIPLHLSFEATDLRAQAAEPLRFRIEFSVSTNTGTVKNQ